MKTVKATALIFAVMFILTSCSKDNYIHNTSLTGGNVGDVVLEPGDTYAVISIQGFGDVTVKLFPECAPVAVENFINLAESGYYDGKIFHRIIEDFMIQGGSPFGDGLSNPDDYSFDVERSYNARHFYGALCMANASGRNAQQFYIVNNKKPNNPEKHNPEDLKKTINYISELLRKNIDDRGLPLNQYGRNHYMNTRDTYTGMLRFRENLTDDIIAKYQSGGASDLDGGYTVFGQTVSGFDVIDAVSAVKVTDNAGGEKSKPTEEIIIESVKIYVQE